MRLAVLAVLACGCRGEAFELQDAEEATYLGQNDATRQEKFFSLYNQARAKTQRQLIDSVLDLCMAAGREEAVAACVREQGATTALLLASLEDEAEELLPAQKLAAAFLRAKTNKV